jgi:hypothetical protein
MDACVDLCLLAILKADHCWHAQQDAEGQPAVPSNVDTALQDRPILEQLQLIKNDLDKTLWDVKVAEGAAAAVAAVDALLFVL